MSAISAGETWTNARGETVLATGMPSPAIKVFGGEAEAQAWLETMRSRAAQARRAPRRKAAQRALEGTDLNAADRRAEMLRRKIAGLRTDEDRPSTPEWRRDQLQAERELLEKELDDLLADPAIHVNEEATTMRKISAVNVNDAFRPTARPTAATEREIATELARPGNERCVAMLNPGTGVVATFMAPLPPDAPASWEKKRHSAEK